MSIRKPVKIECPRYGSKGETVIWNSINVTLDPEAKEELLKGKLNLFQCSICGLESLVPVDLLYHDMQNKFVAQFYPFHWIDKDNFLDEFGDNAQIDPGVPEKDMPDYFRNIHIVFSMDELMRYIRFRDKLAQHRACGKSDV